MHRVHTVTRWTHTTGGVHVPQGSHVLPQKAAKDAAEKPSIHTPQPVWKAANKPNMATNNSMAARIVMVTAGGNCCLRLAVTKNGGDSSQTM